MNRKGQIDIGQKTHNGFSGGKVLSLESGIVILKRVNINSLAHPVVSANAHMEIKSFLIFQNSDSEDQPRR